MPARAPGKGGRRASVEAPPPAIEPAADATTEAILRHWRSAVPDDRMAHLVRDAARGVTRSLQWRLAQHGVSFGHWVFLRILWEGDGLSQRALSEQAGLMESTTHTALLRMEQSGYIERRKLAGNLRRQHVFLTRRGRQLKSVLVPLAEQVNEVAMEGVTDAAAAAARGALLAMVVNLAADERRAIEAGMPVPSTRSVGARTG